MTGIIGKEGTMTSITEFRGKYYFLSNFYNASVTYDGLTYQNNEAAFQAQKCTTLTGKQRFTDLNPSEAKKLGRRVQLRTDWEQVKIQIMYEIVLAKFKQNPDLAALLLNTGEAHLEEGNTWGDKIWGTVNGVGANNLGKILMRVRSEIK